MILCRNENKSSFGVVLFHSTSHALRAEKVSKEAGLTIKLIPVPRQLSSDCGVALRFPWKDAAHVQSLLAEKGVPIAGVHRLE